VQPPFQLILPPADVDSPLLSSLLRERKSSVIVVRAERSHLAVIDLTFVAPEQHSPNLNCCDNLSIENIFMGFSLSLINYFCIALMSFILKKAFDG
jgi:hypothetical protein